MASAMHRRKHSSRASSAPTTGRPRKVVSSAFVPKAVASSSGSPARDTTLLEQHHRAAAAAAARPGGALGPRCRTATLAAAQHSRPARRQPLALVAAALPAAAAAAAATTLDGALTTPVKLVVPYHPTSHGQQLVLVGDCEALGNWDPKKGVQFTWCEGHSHSAQAELPIHSAVACKLVVLSDNGGAAWEPDADRELLLAPTSLASRAAGYTVLCHWGYPSCTQVLPNSLRRGGASAAAAAASAASGRASGRQSRLGSSRGENPIIAGVKRVLTHASSSRERLAVIPGIVSSWEEGPGAAAEAETEAETEEEEVVVMVQCQVSVLVPPTGPQLGPDQSLVLVGSSAALGRWDPANGLPLERSGGEESPLWSALAELPLGEGLQAKVVMVDTVSGAPQSWEPCENRDLPVHLGATRPVMVTAYWGLAPTHCLEVDRLSGATASSPQVVQLLRQQLAATSTQLDGLRRERDEARKVMVNSEDHMRKLDVEATFFDRGTGRQEMVQLAEQLSTTRRLYETTKREAQQLGGTVGVTRQLCEAAKRELSGLAQQLEAAKRAYEALVPQVERMEKQLSSTTCSFEATKPELLALDAQLERARGLFDRTLQKIEAAKALSGGQGDIDSMAAAAVARRRGDSTTTAGRLREVQLIRH